MSEPDNIYVTLFDLLLNHKWEQFIKIIKNNKDDVDVNVRDNRNNFMLSYAIMFNKDDIVRLILKHGGRIDILDHENRSVLYNPIYYRYDKILDHLLEFNKNTIGVSILDIKDLDGKFPINYAIDGKNSYALKKIMLSGGNPNKKDGSGYNSLHNAIYTRDVDIINIILKDIHDVNGVCATGETALHIASNLQLYDICDLLISHGADVNRQDDYHEFSCLHYVVAWGNLKLTKLYMKNGSNPNTQDLHGNTALHHSVLEDNYACTIEMLDPMYTKHPVNVNLWNVNGKIPIHIFFIDYNEDKLHYIDKFMKGSSMIIKDNTKNNALHYLTAFGIWKRYQDVLQFKKLDVFSKNDSGLTPLDYVADKDIEDFINMCVTSYINRLKNNKGKWIDEMDRICSLEIEKLSDKDIKKIKAENKDNVQYVCEKIINKKIKASWKKIKDGKDLCDTNKSYPKKNICKIKQLIGENVNVCTFTGESLDVLVGLLYLLDKHESACSILSNNSSNDDGLCKFYKTLGIYMKDKCEFLNFELIWTQYKLYIMDSFHDLFKSCIRRDNRFIIIPLGIDMPNGNHANYLLYDNKKKELERFEPHGTTFPIGFNYRPTLLDDILEKKIEGLEMGIKYIRPIEYLPKVGFQSIESREESRKKIGDPGGFCAIWSIWYIDMRLTNPEISRNDLVKYLIETIKEKNMSFKNLIRNYSKDIIDLRDKILTSVDMDINEWITDQYTNDQYKKFVKIVNNKIIELLER